MAGLVTALATGLGAVPFFFRDRFSTRWEVGLWGFASGIMGAASVFGLFGEGLNSGTPVELGIGAALGAGLVYVASDFIHEYEFAPREYVEADFKKMVLILGVLTVHSFPEGVAVGVSFADLGLADGGIGILGFSVPLIALFITLAISIHNIPEGIATSIPLRNLGVDNWKLVYAAVFSSLPQPLGAVLAFAFVRVAREFLPYGFGFAGGAMIFLVLTEFIPEALEDGKELPGGGRRELASGILAGILLMLPLLLFI
jgi:ZIP family zinc transporter